MKQSLWVTGCWGSCSGKKEDAELWKSILPEWPDFALDSEGSLAIATGYPYIESHRHFSHLAGWHLLGTIDWSKGEMDKEIIRNTLQKLEKVGTDWWCGYSYSWMGNLYARAFMGDKAAESLRIFSEAFCLPNSFHVNGDQLGKGYSKFTYRPFTLEGNFAFAAGIQEMLIQSHSGIIHIFPAIPETWRNVAFKTLRAEGAFIVSARQKNGNVEEVEIISENGGVCYLKNPFGTNKYYMKYGSSKSVKTENETIIIEFPENGKIILSVSTG